MTATRTAAPRARTRRDRPEPLPQSPGRSLRSLLPSLALFLAMAVVVVTVLLSQFGTVRGGSPPLAGHDEAVGGAATGALAAPWRAVRGDWARTDGGAAVATPGDRLSVAVRPVGGVDGTIEVTGGDVVDGWSVVWRWQDPGSYGLAVVEPSEGTVSLVAVVSDRTRLLAQAALPADVDLATVAVELSGPVAKVRVDGAVVVAGRDDRLTTGTDAGVAVVGDASGATFDRFRTRPPDGATVREVEPGSGS